MCMPNAIAADRMSPTRSQKIRLSAVRQIGGSVVCRSTTVQTFEDTVAVGSIGKRDCRLGF